MIHPPITDYKFTPYKIECPCGFKYEGATPIFHQCGWKEPEEEKPDKKVRKEKS